jgi:transposase
MRITKLEITHPEITKENLRDAVSNHKNARIGLRIAVLQEVLDHAHIKSISIRHDMSRSQIYKIVRRVNNMGLAGLADEAHKGRPRRLTREMEEEIKRVLLKSPIESGYSQYRWDGVLLSQFIHEKYNITIKVRQCQYLFHRLGLSLQRGRRKAQKANPKEQIEFIKELKKTCEQKTRRSTCVSR